MNQQAYNLYYQQLYKIYWQMLWLQYLQTLTQAQQTSTEPNPSSVINLQSSELGGTASRLSGGKFANGAMSAAFRVAFNDGFNKFPSKYPGGRFATQKEATEAAHSNNQSARKIGRTEFGKYSGLRGDANGVYVYRNEDQGYFEVSNVMVIPRDGKTWALPNAAFGDSPFSETPPHINSWFGDDKTIVALVVTQDYERKPNRFSASYQKYANKIGTVQVSTENGYHHTSYKFGITTQTFNAQSATEKYE
ncbi:Rhs-family protein [hydrothermal vent metagenome]|uniref:Rhs-family protein n=1 Tax=hydrothermal vent metagenome TaxID=652676 RepID=A0A3B0UW49_9ZZZZ